MDGGDRIGVDDAKTRKSGGKTLSSGKTAPLKPKAGLSGPRVQSQRVKIAPRASVNEAGTAGDDIVYIVVRRHFVIGMQRNP